MKKIVSALLVCVLLIGCAFAFASCGKKISGTYADSLGITTYEFSGKNVTLTVKNIIGDDLVLEGTYEISEENGESHILFTFEGNTAEAAAYSIPVSFAQGKEGDQKYIKIGGITYNKVD